MKRFRVCTSKPCPCLCACLSLCLSVCLLVCLFMEFFACSFACVFVCLCVVVFWFALPCILSLFCVVRASRPQTSSNHNMDGSRKLKDVPRPRGKSQTGINVLHVESSLSASPADNGNRCLMPSMYHGIVFKLSKQHQQPDEGTSFSITPKPKAVYSAFTSRLHVLSQAVMVMISVGRGLGVVPQTPSACAPRRKMATGPVWAKRSMRIIQSLVKKSSKSQGCSPKSRRLASLNIAL